MYTDSQMDSSLKQGISALEAALKTARENENRWMEISAEFSSDAERMDQWRSTAKLRRREVERIEARLAVAAQPVCIETVGANNGMGEAE